MESSQNQPTVLELFKIKLQIPTDTLSQTFAKYSLGHLNYFALTLQCSNDLLLASDNTTSPTNIKSTKWTMIQIPWFDDETYKMSSLSFDEDGVLYIGTTNGIIYELNTSGVFNQDPQADLKELFHSEDLQITDILIWCKETNKTLICNGGHGKFIIINSIPIVVTFTSPIISMDLFNNSGMACVLVCLSTGTNLYTILNDLEVEETLIKKSIFKRAKENIISRFAEDKKKSINITSIANVKFITLDIHSQGLLRVKSFNTFLRFDGGRLDLFDSDFRQTSSTFIPNNLNKLYSIQSLYYGIDQENIVRVYLLHSGVMKELTSTKFKSKIISIESVGELNLYSIFILAEDGIYEMTIKKPPLETCIDLLLNRTPVDVVCNALNVPKTIVYIQAGDVCSNEGKFATAIIYYKLAGLSHTKILTKFGSNGHIPAMLCFYELAEKERCNLRDKCIMADVALLGRIEQFLRGGGSRKDAGLLGKMLQTNLYYSMKVAVELCHEELVWTLRLIARARLCFSEILYGLFENKSEVISFKDIINLMTTKPSWITVFSAQRPIFTWFSNEIRSNLRNLDNKHLCRLVVTLIPWRRELQKRLGDADSEIIDFTGGSDGSIITDYIELFITVVLEVVKRNDQVKCKLPQWTSTHVYPYPNILSASPYSCSCVRNGKCYMWGENRTGRLGIHASRAVIDTPTPIYLLPSLKLTILVVSSGHAHSMALTHCGTILIWGSNSHGQLGVGRNTIFTNNPTPLEFNMKFKSIAAGAFHSVALDENERVWTWGWGIYGQLGYGGIENLYNPTMIPLKEKIVKIAAGHSHTGLITNHRKAMTFGCSHFGQIGHGSNAKVKIPTMLEIDNCDSIICGTCSTVVLTTTGLLYFFGLNPASLKSLLTSSRRKSTDVPPLISEEKDYLTPWIIDTSHLDGEITKVSIATTHFALITKPGYIYTWGLGKSGQLIRQENDNKMLQLVEEMLASDIACAGDCTFVMELGTGKLFGCGFNSSGQLGRMESEDESAVITIRTKKRVVKVRQPANIYIKPREIIGLPKITDENYTTHEEEIVCPYNIVDQNCLHWCLKEFIHHYSPKRMINQCLLYSNLQAAIIIETLIEDHEAALKHHLNINSSEAIANYIQTIDSNTNLNCLQQANVFIEIVIQHWIKCNIPGLNLQLILEGFKEPWNTFVAGAIKGTILKGGESAKWIAANFTPVFILSCSRRVQGNVSST